MPDDRSPAVIDAHGHYTNAPPALVAVRTALLDGGDRVAEPSTTDDEIRATIDGSQLRLQDERGIDQVLISPRAGWMALDVADVESAARWARTCNDLIARLCDLYPGRFAGVCQLPQVPGNPVTAAVGELRRCVDELGFVGCVVNPDPGGNGWDGPPLSDPSWFPLYEAMVELGVPGLLHVSGSCNPNVHTLSAYYLGAATTAFTQLLMSDVFDRFPGLRFVLPHGGGAVPYHWGRFEGFAMRLERPPLAEWITDRLYFDTCVYHRAGIDCLLDAVPSDNVLFGSEMMGAVSGLTDADGHHFDDTRRLIVASDRLDDVTRANVLGANARRAYPRLP